jgi:2-polyprenyl-3-methyl-5-hydroxy-6-metoxy-1,4-benzoquinol methylase
MDTLPENCPVCGETEHQRLYPVSKGELLRCRACHLVFFSPRPSFEELTAFYDAIEYRNGYGASAMAGLNFAQARYQHLHQTIKRYAPEVLNFPHRNLLDVGCGKGDLLKIASNNQWDIAGIELSSLAVQQANALLGEPKVQVGDLQSINLSDSTYNLVTSYHVIEHLLDPIDNLVRIRQLLHSSGIAFIETPNIDSLGARVRGKKWSHIIPPEHINYFNSKSLAFALRKAGFQRYKIFTSAPPIIESIENWNVVLKVIATKIYDIAPLLNLGAALQAIAFKE